MKLKSSNIIPLKITWQNIDDMVKQGYNYSFIGKIMGVSRQAIRQKYLKIRNPNNADHQKKWREKIKKENPEEYRRRKREYARTYRKNNF